MSRPQPSLTEELSIKLITTCPDVSEAMCVLEDMLIIMMRAAKLDVPTQADLLDALTMRVIERAKLVEVAQ